MRRAWQGAALVTTACTSVYAYDEFCLSQVIQRNVRALLCGVSLFVEYKFIWTPYNASEVHGRVARRIVDTCKTNEGLYVKFGQLMGSMEMALPVEYRGPLGELHDKAKTFSTETVLSLLQEELSEEDYSKISDISDSPVASASVAQVHTAYYDGHKVAVKVQKPNIKVQTYWDLLMYKFLLTVLEYSFDIPLVWSYDFVKRQLESELDFNIEAKNAAQARKDFMNSRECRHVAYVPDTHCSSRRVLVSEWIDDAVKITDTESLKALGIDTVTVVQDATKLFAFQIFGTGNVHCDPHPGNLLVRVLPTSEGTDAGGSIFARTFDWVKQALGYSKNSGKQPHQIVLIDHGLYVHLNPKLKRDYVDFWMAMMYGDDDKLREQCSQWGIHDSELFAAMTLMRRRHRKENQRNRTLTFSSTESVDDVNHKQYENEEGEHLREASDVDKEKSAEKARRSAEFHQRMKERVKRLLGDTSQFPDELGFVNRSVNYIRATNWTHGSPVDRIAIFADTAARASAQDYGGVGEWSWKSEYSVYRLRLHLLYELWQLSQQSSSLSSTTIDVSAPRSPVPSASSIWK